MTRKLSLLMLLLFSLVLLSGVFLPLYSDEVMTKLKMARFFLEEGQRVSYFPQCTATLGHAIAWVFYPAAGLLSAVYGYLEPLGMRLSGVVLALAWFVLLALWCRRQEPQHWVGRFSLLVAFGALGVVPYLWVMSRPEHFMMLPMLGLTIIALYGPSAGQYVKHVVAVMLLTVLASIFFFTHPKSVFFTPFVLVAVWTATRNCSWFVRAGMLVYVVLLALQALRDASTLGACQDAPGVQALLALNILRPGLLFESPLEFMLKAGSNVLHFFPRVVQHLTFRPEFQSGWLPPIAHVPGIVEVLNLAVAFAVCAFIAITNVLAGVGMLSALRRRCVSVPLLLAALLAAGDLLNVVLYNLQNFYAAIQYMPISMVILALLLQSSENDWIAALLRKYESRAASGVSVLSVASLVALMLLVTPNVLRNAESASASIPGQPLSIPVFGAKAHLDSIRELGRQCHIPEQSASFVVVDHMTYFAYKKDLNPVHVHYVSEDVYGADLKGRLLPFLKGFYSPGLITRCEWVPASMRSRQVRNSFDYCCVDFSD
ncbi:hypothetical protein [Pseudomonas guariconensis]|nr:hypothetical protein [Pseudomonas guariconensis]